VKKVLYWILRPQVIAGALLAVFYLPYCGFIFGCGCVQIWEGAHHACNAFRAGPPDCPFCVAPFCKDCGPAAQSFLQIIPFAIALIAGTIGIHLLQKRKGRLYLRDLITGLIIMATSLLLLAYVYGKMGHYPYFLPSIASIASTALINPMC
jgi:hypothetical protein